MKHQKSKLPRKRLMRRAVCPPLISDITPAKLKALGFALMPGKMAVKYCDKHGIRVTVRVSSLFDIASWKTGQGILPGKNDDYTEGKVFKIRYVKQFCKTAFR